MPCVSICFFYILYKSIYTGTVLSSGAAIALAVYSAVAIALVVFSILQRYLWVCLGFYVYLLYAAVCASLYILYIYMFIIVMCLRTKARRSSDGSYRFEKKIVRVCCRRYRRKRERQICSSTEFSVLII